jgi:hypothetical protein
MALRKCLLEGRTTFFQPAGGRLAGFAALSANARGGDGAQPGLRPPCDARSPGGGDVAACNRCQNGSQRLPQILGGS